MKDELETYLEYFDEVELVKECDGYFYNVHDMLKVFVIGLLCGLKNMHEIHEWANEETIFAFLENRFGITKLPSYYWFTCLLKTINIDSLNKCFMNLAHELIEQARMVNFAAALVRLISRSSFEKLCNKFIFQNVAFYTAVSHCVAKRRKSAYSQTDVCSSLIFKEQIVPTKQTKLPLLSTARQFARLIKCTITIRLCIL